MVAVAATFSGCLGARILAFYPFPPRSHHAVFTPIIRELANRGHHLTYLTPHRLEDPPPKQFYEEILIKDPIEEKAVLHFLGAEVVNLRNFNNMWSLEGLRSLQSLVKYTAVKIFTDPEVQRLIESDRKFDAVMDMSTIIQGPAAVLQHRFNAVGIEVIPLGCSYWTEFLLGGAINPSYMMDYSSAYTDRMTFVERFINTLSYMGIIGMYNFFVMPVCQAIADQHMRYPGWETRPSLTELTANKSLAIINTHFSLNYPFPRPPHFIEVAGMNVQPNKPLPKDLQESMDGATDGVIYLSLGTNIEVSQFLEGHLLKSFTNVLGNLKQKIIWKWESDIFPNKPDNVITAKWLPQQDILAHKNCKLFITQGGFMSLSETVYNSVPVLGIPLMGDQRKNMVHASSKGYGILLEVENITESSFSWAVNEILYNPS
ncbi:hypothetical protein AAG570_011988 [Ranatra chinensis]|uniref:UDP-glucuronosyltransferase n=1 Tax=Ranatra chinensis TaxID=642074 RepID=A0ABD0YVY4_9HEMI